jgi:hypothetical protein
VCDTILYGIRRQHTQTLPEGGSLCVTRSCTEYAVSTHRPSLREGVCVRLAVYGIRRQHTQTLPEGGSLCVTRSCTEYAVSTHRPSLREGVCVRLAVYGIRRQHTQTLPEGGSLCVTRSCTEYAVSTHRPSLREAGCKCTAPHRHTLWQESCPHPRESACVWLHPQVTPTLSKYLQVPNPTPTLRQPAASNNPRLLSSTMKNAYK